MLHYFRLLANYWKAQLSVNIRKDIRQIIRSNSVITSWKGLNTGCFLMFSVITNICNKKTKGPTIMELFTATGKMKRFFFWQLEMFDVSTTGDTAHMRHHGDACVARTWITYRRAPCHPWCTHRTSLVVKKKLFSFPVAVNHSIKVDPLVFWL